MLTKSGIKEVIFLSQLHVLSTQIFWYVYLIRSFEWLLVRFLVLNYNFRLLFTTIKNRRNPILNWRIGLLDFERSLNSELAHKPFFAIVLSPSQGNKKKSVTETPEELETESNKSRICNLQLYKIKATWEKVTKSLLDANHVTNMVCVD